jgi:hypothetical protein
MHWLRSCESLRARGNRAEVEAFAVLQLLSFAPEVGRDATLMACRLSKRAQGAHSQEEQEDHQRSANHDFFLFAGFDFAFTFDPALSLALLAVGLRELDFLLAAVSAAGCTRFAFFAVGRRAVARFLDRPGVGSLAAAAILVTVPAFPGVILSPRSTAMTLAGADGAFFRSARVTVAI